MVRCGDAGDARRWMTSGWRWRVRWRRRGHGREMLTERQAAMLRGGKPGIGVGSGVSGGVLALKGPGGRLRCGAEQSAVGHHAAEHSGILRRIRSVDPGCARAGSEAHAIRDRLLADPRWHVRGKTIRQVFARRQRLVEQAVPASANRCAWRRHGRKLDLYRVFAERMVRLAGRDGAIGMVVPSAFHANEGATGIRKLYLQQTRVEQCLSFENRNSLFDIHASIKFALVVARRPGPTRSVRCGFYLTDFAQIDEPERLMDYDIEFIAASGGAYATLLELREPRRLQLARRMLVGHQRFGEWTDRVGISLSREIHMTDDAGRFHGDAAHPAGPHCRTLSNRAATICLCMKARRSTSSAIDGIHRRDTRFAWPTWQTKPQTAASASLLSCGMPRRSLDRPTSAPRSRRCCRRACCAVTPSASSARRPGGPTRRHCRWSAS